MTTRHLTGAYPGGYTLSAAYTGLVVEATASVGGTGVSAGFFATIRNDGVIDAAATSNGVSLSAGGIVTNGSATDTTALIEGYRGVYARGAPATVANFGTIVGLNSKYGAGVLLGAGGSVTNGSSRNTTARITAPGYGVMSWNAPATVANFGTIDGTPGVGRLTPAGISLQAGGSIINGSATDTVALVLGKYGVVARGSLDVANFGTIRGSAPGGPMGGGIYFYHGGSLTNGSAADTTALVEGGVGVSGFDPLAVSNFGTIAGTGVGADFHDGGSLVNGSTTDTGALIEGRYGVISSGGAIIATNFGTIEASGDYGFVFYGGGSLTNGSPGDKAARIVGSIGGVFIGNSPATISNFGTVAGSPGSGIRVSVNSAGPTIIVNGSLADTAALIEGAYGVTTDGRSPEAVTITNFGTIAGADGLAVGLRSATDVLQVEAGSVFRGAVTGGGSTLDLASGVGTISGLSGGKVTVSGSMATTTFTNFGTLEIAGGSTFTLTGGGTLGAGGTTKLIDEGTLVVFGAIGGTGTLSVEGTLTLGAGARVNAAAATFGAGALINGAGILTLTNATLGGLSVGGKVVIVDAGLFDQTGAIVLGKGARGPRLTIAQGAVYRLDGDVGVARRSSKPPAILVDGLFVKSAGTGVSSVGVAVSDVGTIEAATGTLSFLARVDGTGMMKTDAGATLRFANKVASTLTARFAGAGGALALGAPAQFAATIAGFAAGETIDLVNTAATGAVLNASDQLVITDGATAVATLQLSGDYAGDSFDLASDGHGGTAITLTPGPAAAPAARLVSAMASLTAGAGAAGAPVWKPEDAVRPLFASPRTAFA